MEPDISNIDKDLKEEFSAWEIASDQTLTKTEEKVNSEE